MNETTDIKFETIVQYRSAFEHLGCAQLHDTAKDYCAVLGNAFRCVNGQKRLAGPVFPVATDGDILPGLYAMEKVPKGWILVISDAMLHPEAIVGDVFCACSEVYGIAGILVDGAVRDLDQLSTLSIPVFAREVCYTSARTSQCSPASIPSPIHLSGTEIGVGDWVFGDSDGLIVVRRNFVSAALKAAKLRREFEDRIVEQVRAGSRYSDIVGLNEFIGGQRDLKFKI